LDRVRALLDLAISVPNTIVYVVIWHVT
jgi:hypothetical protein